MDPEYCPDRITLLRAFSIIEEDLRTAFDYLEPADENLNVFSHRLYELLLRACTEFEANCKGILADNGYTKQDRWNVSDYRRIERSSRLSEYQVQIPAWRGNKGKFKPFESCSEQHSSPLKWYRDYNSVKHNRSEKFELANLENVLLAVSGLLVILFSQCYLLCFTAYQTLTMSSSEDGWEWAGGTVFRVKPPTDWTHDELYDFPWEDLKKVP